MNSLHLPRESNNPLVDCVANDFTGAEASMEVLTFAGLPAILLLGVPTAEQVSAGSDISGNHCTEPVIRSLEVASSAVLGAAICKARSEQAFNGVETALKVGQMVSRGNFSCARDGGGL